MPLLAPWHLGTNPLAPLGTRLRSPGLFPRASARSRRSGLRPRRRTVRTLGTLVPPTIVDGESSDDGQSDGQRGAAASGRPGEQVL